jgi:hypothetical protein
LVEKVAMVVTALVSTHGAEEAVMAAMAAMVEKQP